MKDQIKNILVPFDFSKTAEIALDEASNIATLIGAKVFVLHIDESGSFFGINPAETRFSDKAVKEIAEELKGKLTEILNKTEKRFNIKTKHDVVSGHIHDEIVSYTKKEKIDLIVMGTHGAKGYKEFFVGSNTQRVVTLSDVPVLTFLDELKGSKLRNILIPIDNSTHSREKVNMAIVFAKLYNSGIHILGLPGTDNEKEINKFMVKISSVEELISDTGLKFETTISHEDNMASTAIKYATENHCDLIVINTGHESQISGTFPYTFAQQIVNHSPVPVLSIKHTDSHFSIGTPGYGI